MADGDYRPVQLPFAQPFSPRQGQLYKGAMMRNLYSQNFSDGPYAVRRAGILDLGKVTDPNVSNGAFIMGLLTIDVRLSANFPFVGWVFWQAVLGDFYYSKLYNGVTTTHWYANGEPLGSGLWAVQTNFVGPTVNYVMQSGSDIFTVVLTGSPPAPSPDLAITRVTQTITQMMPGIAFLDGAVYVISQTDNQIHGCALQDPTTWNPLNVVGASSSWGRAVAISRHLNYILGFFEFGLQVYYDAGLAPPGSPLAPLPNASFLTGLAGQSSVVSLADCTIFIGKSAAGNISVYMLSGLQLGVISNPMVDAALAEHSGLLRVDYNFNGSSSVSAMAWEDKGNPYYVLTFGRIAFNFGYTSYSLAYNLTTQEWTVFTNGSNVGEIGLTPFISQDNLMVGPGAGPTTPSEVHFYGISDTAYQDFTGGFQTVRNISALALTASQDFQTGYKKFIKRLSVQADTIPEMLSMRYSDDDYTTYSGYYLIDLSKQRKKVDRLGSFYQRNFEFTYSGLSPFRVKVYEIDVSGGSV